MFRRPNGIMGFTRVIAACALLLVSGCGEQDAGVEFADSYPLPDRLTQAPRTSPIGRPAAFPKPYQDGADPTDDQDFFAAYEVKGGQAEAAARHWEEQLQPCAQFFDLTLRETGSRTILLIQANRLDAECDVDPSQSYSEVGPLQQVNDAERTGGAQLFSHQDQPMPIPPDTSTLTPTFPTSCGTAGSFTVLAADDGTAAINAMLDAASEYDDEHVVRPSKTTVDGVEVTSGTFAIWAGGWTFDAVAVRGPDDPADTVYVRSCAD